jgi:hypothetical protein
MLCAAGAACDALRASSCAAHCCSAASCSVVGEGLLDVAVSLPLHRQLL